MATTKPTETTNKPVRKFKKVSSNYATPWKPTVGDTIEGIYKGFDLIPGERGEKFKSHRVEIEGKEEPMGVAGAMLDTKLIRIPKGSYVRITRTPDKKTRNGTAHDFDVETEEGVKFLEHDNEPDTEF